MRKVDAFRHRPMPPSVEVVIRPSGKLDRLIKCPNSQCRGRHYASLITADDTCLNCGTAYTLEVAPPTEEHLYVMYGHTRFHS